MSVKPDEPITVTLPYDLWQAVVVSLDDDRRTNGDYIIGAARTVIQRALDTARRADQSPTQAS